MAATSAGAWSCPIQGSHFFIVAFVPIVRTGKWTIEKRTGRQQQTSMLDESKFASNPGHLEIREILVCGNDTDGHLYRLRLITSSGLLMNALEVL